MSVVRDALEEVIACSPMLTLQSFSYAESPAGTILSETDTPASSNSPANYSYDAKSRVTSMTPGTGTAKNYTFDASGNLVTLPTGAVVPSNGYNDAAELLQSTLAGTTTNYTYNQDGERLTSVQGSTTESSGTWNGAGQLTTYDDGAADMTAATYDGQGRRASSAITPSGGSAVTEQYVWGASNLLMDSGNAYIYAGNSSAPIEQVNLASGTITYLSADSLGSVRGTVSGSGALTGTTSYDAWGNPSSAGGLTAATPFGFAGGYTDPDGLIYLVNRYYDPATGQFTSVDPDISATLQPYAYAAGDPVDQTDPTGMDPPGGGGGGSSYSKRYFYARNFTVGAIKHQLSTWTYRIVHGLASAGHLAKAAALYAIYVCAGCAWDLKVPLRGSHDIDKIAGQKGEAKWYTKVSASEQSYYNIWGNISFAYVGTAAGFPGWFLQGAGGLEGYLHGTDTTGNKDERQMGIDLYNWYGGYSGSDINGVIINDMPPPGTVCDFLKFPDAKGTCPRGENW
jgi:RHS repeat-associated protein